MTEHRDPRRRRPFAAPDASAAAGLLESAADAMRADQLQRGPALEEPPTGLIDLAAIRAALGASAETVNPAAARWLAGEDDPEPVFGDVYVDEPAPEPEPMPVEWPCEQLGNAFHSDAPCGPAHHPVVAVSVPDPEPEPVPVSPEPVPAVAPPAPVFTSEQAAGWRSRHDERSRAFGVRQRFAGSAPLTDHVWPVGPVLDQGEEGACVGFGIVDALNATATGDADRSAAAASAIYRRAQQLDQFPGEAYSGTSVLAGMQAAVEAGACGGYLWCFGTKDVAQAVLQRGPVVVGISWPAAWFDAGPDGLLSLDGVEVGDLGHCLAVVGILLRGPAGQPGPYFVLQNSYGPGWGDRGFGYLHHRDLAVLLHGTGEAAIPTAQAAP